MPDTTPSSTPGEGVSPPDSSGPRPVSADGREILDMGEFQLEMPRQPGESPFPPGVSGVWDDLPRFGEPLT